MRLDRRRFLAAGGVALAGAPWASFAAAAAPRGQVLVEAGIAESVAFAGAFVPAARIDCRLDEVCELHTRVARSLDAGCSVYACTREASRFVLGELFRGSGSAPNLLGRHRRVAGSRWRHEVFFDTGEDLQALFECADWPLQFARILRRSTPAAPQPRRTVEAQSAIPARSPGYVLSWHIG